MDIIMENNNLVYVLIWEYDNLYERVSGVSAIFSNIEAAEKYKKESEETKEYDDIKYSIVKFIVHH